jgi:hypothetical protein
MHSYAAGDRAWGEAVLRRAVALAEVMAGPHVPVTGRLVAGPPVEAVLAASPDARLVVVRRRDVLHLFRVLAGEGASRRAPHRHLPVACVPPTWEPTPGRRLPVTVGLEETSHGAELLAQSLEIARVHGTSLRVVHAWHFPGRYDAMIEERVGDEWGELARAEIEDLVAGARGDNHVDVEIEVRHAWSTEALLDAASRSDVLVLGRNESADGYGVRLGKSPRAILHAAECPVLLLSAEHRAVAAPATPPLDAPLDPPLDPALDLPARTSA